MKTCKLSIISVAVALASVSGAHAAEAVVGGDEAGTFKIPGSNTSLGIYGYVHVDVIKDLNAGTKDWAYDGGSIGITSDPSTVNADSRKGKLNVTAQTSRFGIKSSTQTEIGKIRTVLEGDFVGSTFRLRHAYGDLSSGWGSLLAGQFWTLFRSGEAIPETVDFNGQGSVASGRKPQVRYTTAPGAAGSFAFSIEVPANPVNNSIVKAPTLAAAWVKGGDWGTVSARTIANQIAYETIPTTATSSTSKTKYGFAGSLGGAFKLGQSDTLQALVTAGTGISQYVAAASYNPETVSGTKIELTKITAYTAGWQHRWAPTLRSNLSYGYTRLGDQYRDAVARPANRTVDGAFVNLVWSPVKNAEFGLEFGHAQRKLSNGERGKFNRVQTSFHYNF